MAYRTQQVNATGYSKLAKATASNHHQSQKNEGIWKQYSPSHPTHSAPISRSGFLLPESHQNRALYSANWMTSSRTSHFSTLPTRTPRPDSVVALPHSLIASHGNQSWSLPPTHIPVPCSWDSPGGLFQPSYSGASSSNSPNSQKRFTMHQVPGVSSPCLWTQLLSCEYNRFAPSGPSGCCRQGVIPVEFDSILSPAALAWRSRCCCCLIQAKQSVDTRDLCDSRVILGRRSSWWPLVPAVAVVENVQLIEYRENLSSTDFINRLLAPILSSNRIPKVEIVANLRVFKESERFPKKYRIWGMWQTIFLLTERWKVGRGEFYVCCCTENSPLSRIVLLHKAV